MIKKKLYPLLYWIPRQLPDDPQKLADIRPDSAEWAAQELHLFIVTDAGKPIFTRYGTIPMVSPIMCSYYAISSLMESLHEELDHFRAGSSTFVFLRKHSFIFIAVSKSGLPISYLFKQLQYLYLLFLSLFSEYVLTQISQKPSIDFRLYAEPNRPTWNGVINNMSEDPAFIFVPWIPVSCVNPKLRQTFSNSQSLSRLQSCKLSMLIKKNRVVAFGSHICDPTSLRLIIDLVWTPVFQDEEHWVPLYLRDSNKTNFLFTHNIKGTDYYIVMLCDVNEEMDTYHSVSVSLYNELMEANRNNELALAPKKASNVFYFWALKSLTYGQVYITDPDPRFFSDKQFKKSPTKNSNQNSNTKRNQNLSENQEPKQNFTKNSNDNQVPNERDTKNGNKNNYNQNEKDTKNENDNDNQNEDNVKNANDTKNENENDNDNQNENNVKNANDTKNENENDNDNNNENDNQMEKENEVQNSNDNQKQNKGQSENNSNEIQMPSSDSSNSGSREKMRELIRQLAKSVDNVESNGNDGEYMFRGEKEVIVVFKSKEMEIYAVARSEDLPDKEISKKLGELRQFINEHMNELIITQNKIYIEKF